MRACIGHGTAARLSWARVQRVRCRADDASIRPTSVRRGCTSATLALARGRRALHAARRCVSYSAVVSGDHLTFGTELAVTTEKFDAWGRLVEVVEPNSTRTRYGYDLADRLVSVCVNATDSSTCAGQQRSFTYDGRGFLVSETHPEKGTTFYSSFDARGKAWGRREGEENGGFDVEFLFDAAERPTVIRLRRAPGGTAPRTLKSFEYGLVPRAENAVRIVNDIMHIVCVPSSLAELLIDLCAPVDTFRLQVRRKYPLA